VERLFSTLNTELLPELPGHLVGAKPATPPRLSLSQLDRELGGFLVGTYNTRVHGEIGAVPQTAWLADGWLPRLPSSLAALDLLLIRVAEQRKVHRDGIHFQGMRYMDPTLAGFVGEAVTIRYDPRDMAEVRVFHRNSFLCQAISPEHSGQSITLKDIQTARVSRRRALRGEINARTVPISDFLLKPPEAVAIPVSHAKVRAGKRKPALRTYFEDSR
jgi:putative transposase